MSPASTRRKIWLLVAAVLVVAGIVVGTWSAALNFVSPEQRAAAASPPPEQPVVATVTRGDLVDNRTLPAEITSTQAQSMPVLTQAGQDRTVVTNVLAKTGDSVHEGAALLETNGTPVFVMASSFPFYRDMGVGDMGPDVRALQKNLVDLGLLGGADGTFGDLTANAVAQLYDNAGYTAPRRAAPTSGGADGRADSPSPDAKPSRAPAKTKAFVPLSALLAAAQLPAAVQQVPAEGTIVTDQTTVALASEAVEVKASVPDSLVQKIQAGQDAKITLPDGTQLPAKTEKIATITGDNGKQTTVTLRRADGKPIDADLIGKPVSVQVTIAIVAKDALIVPLIAVSKHGGGNSVVLVKQPDGSFAQTPVNVIATLGGAAALDPNGKLHVNDKVQVG